MNRSEFGSLGIWPSRSSAVSDFGTFVAPPRQFRLSPFLMSSSSTPELDYRPSYRAALGVSLGALVLYLSRSRRPRRCGTRANTSPPRTRSGCRIRRAIRSSSSSAACSRSCRSRRRVAVRINILAAICSAVSAGMWFLITERVLVELVPAALAAHRSAASLARADRRDGVHRVESVGREREGLHGLARRHRDHLVADDPLVRRSRRPQGRSHPRARRVPAAASATRTTWRACSPRRRSASRCSSSARARSSAGSCCSRASARCVLGLTPFATQPIRAAYFPAINEGEPTACRTKLELVVHVLEGHVRRVHVQLQSRPVRQARPERAAGVVRRAGRDVVAVLQVAVDARRARRPSVRAGAARRGASSCSACSAAGCTSSETGEASGISAR